MLNLLSSISLSLPVGIDLLSASLFLGVGGLVRLKGSFDSISSAVGSAYLKGSILGLESSLKHTYV